jgi:hypothetical protein
MAADWKNATAGNKAGIGGVAAAAAAPTAAVVGEMEAGLCQAPASSNSCDTPLLCYVMFIMMCDMT